MCAGYGFFSPGFKPRFRVESSDFTFEPHYNIRPSLYAPIILKDADTIVAKKAKFGLVPSWAKDPKIGYKMINARSETLLEKPTFRKPFTSQRCLIPADYFVEWQPTPAGKQPYLFRLKTKGLFAMAGIYDIWKDAEGMPLTTFAILTTKPNTLVGKIHDRMPVLLPQDKEEKWLQTTKDPASLLPLLSPFQESLMEKQKISMRINSPNNDDPDVLDTDSS